MDGDSSFNPEKEQLEEQMVLESIFMEEYSLLASIPDNAGRQRSRVQLTILPYPGGDDPNHVDVILLATLPPSYPIIAPLIELRSGSRGLPEPKIAELRDELAAQVPTLLGEVQLMKLAETAREYLRGCNNTNTPSSFYEQMIERQQALAPEPQARSRPSLAHPMAKRLT